MQTGKQMFQLVTILCKSLQLTLQTIHGVLNNSACNIIQYTIRTSLCSSTNISRKRDTACCCCWVLAAAQQMIIISCLLGAKQQTRSSGVQRMNNRTDGRLTVTQTLRGVPIIQYCLVHNGLHHQHQTVLKQFFVAAHQDSCETT